MPIKLGGRTFKDHAAAVAFVKRTHPEIKDPDAYVAEIERKQKKK